MANELIETLGLTVDGMTEDTFRPFCVTGVDEISQMFRFEIDVVSDDPSLDETQIFGRAATLEMGRQDQSAKVYGLITSFQQGIATERGQFVYKAILMPRLQRLDMCRQNQIHGTTSDVSVVDVIRSELTADNLRGPGSSVAGRMTANDFEMRLSRTYPLRDYIVQYEESDLNFICRLAESQGIFFFFDHSSGKDMVVFGDSRVAFSPHKGQSSLPYRRTGGLVEFGESVVRDFTRVAKPLPAKVVLRDYNYRLPHISLTAEAPIDPSGHGVVVEYGDHFRTPEEGSQLARIRAEEIKAQGVVFNGKSDCITLSAGDLFTLSDHFREDFNTRYVITRIIHTATMPVEGLADIDGGTAQRSYSNNFECIANSVEYRPPRRTPKPIMAGLTNALVDAEGSGNRAEIDAQGRYKVRQSFDLREEADGKASLFVRKAEPYGGANSGMHLPLLKNTEVIIACVNGDPNRPIIVGAVPNARNRSVITQNEQTSNRIRTTSGIVLQMDDGAGSSGSGGSSRAGSGGSLAPQTILEGLTSQEIRAGSFQTEPVHVDGMLEQSLEAPRAHESSDSSTDTRLFINVTGDTDGGSSEDSYLRLGAARQSGESDYVADFTNVSDGFLLHTPSDWNSLIRGSAYTRVNSDLRTAANTLNHVAETTMGLASQGLAIAVTAASPEVITDPATAVPVGEFWINTDSHLNESVGGDLNQTVTGSIVQTIQGDNSSNTGGSSWDVTTGNSQEVFMGNQISVTLGSSEEFTLALAIDVAVGMTIDLALAIAIDISLAMRITYEGSINLLVNDGGKVGVKLSYDAEYTVLGATASEVEAAAKGVEASAKSVEASSASVSAKMPGVEAKTQGVSVEVPGLKATI
jgi:type VI secretion system VgrG family protein